MDRNDIYTKSMQYTNFYKHELYKHKPYKHKLFPQIKLMQVKDSLYYLDE